MRSADSHVIEPGDLWQQRVPKDLREKAPRIVNSIDSLRGPLEGEWLICDGIGPQRVAGFAAADVDDPRQRSAMEERGYGQLLSGGVEMLPITIPSDDSPVSHETWHEAASRIGVKLREGQALGEEELRAFLQDRLGRHEVPKHIEFRDALPKTMIGKLSKKELVAEEEAKRETSKA